MRREREKHSDINIVLFSTVFNHYFILLYVEKASKNPAIIPRPTSHQTLVHTLSVIQNMARLPVFLGVRQKKTLGGKTLQRAAGTSGAFKRQPIKGNINSLKRRRKTHTPPE